MSWSAALVRRGGDGHCDLRTPTSEQRAYSKARTCARCARCARSGKPGSLQR